MTGQNYRQSSRGDNGRSQGRHEGSFSAGVPNAVRNSEFGIIQDIVKNSRYRSRIAKNCLSHFLCLLNTSSKRCLFFVPDTSMMPKKIQSEPSDFFRFLIPRTSAPPRVGLKCHDSIASIISEIRRTRSPSCFWTEVIWIFSSFSPRTIPAIAKSTDLALRTVCPYVSDFSRSNCIPNYSSIGALLQ